MWKELYNKLRRLVRFFAGLKVTVYASHAGFFLVLSAFPLLVLLLSLLRYTGLAVDSLTDLLVGVIPNALMPAAKRLILSTYQNTSGAVIGVSAVTALWSASRGIHGLITGLRAVYHVPQRGGYLQRRLVSIGYTFAF